jgi:hypothetical protein
MTKPTKRTLKFLAVPAIPTLATLALIALMFGSTRQEPPAAPASEPEELASDQGLEGDGAVAEPVAADAPAAPTPADRPVNERPRVTRVRAQVVSMDETRMAAGLPPVMAELSRAQSYRPPTAPERMDPVMSAVYRLDRRLHQETWLGRHNAHEAARFQADAAKASDPEERALLERSAELHQRRAQEHEGEMKKLWAERAALTMQGQVSGGGQP